jgi:GSH-dependent disulfide-bond oxidoreductase
VTLDHPIFTRWPAQYPDRLQLFFLPTPNGVKVGIMLEETSLAYEPHRIDITANESHDPAFLALNPNGKIPAIYDPDGPSGTPLALFESGAILLYLADKTGQFISADPNTRYETIQWVMWQMGGVGPTFGQAGFFNKFAGKAYEDKRPRDRYATIRASNTNRGVGAAANFPETAVCSAGALATSPASYRRPAPDRAEGTSSRKRKRPTQVQPW